MLKKIIISLIFFVSTTSLVFAYEGQELLLKGIKQYKNNNYLGTIQTMEKVIKNNPGSTIAYYYRGISYAQIGKSAEAETAYNKVIILDPYSQLATYAEIGKKQLHSEENDNNKNEENDFLKKFKNDFYSDNVKEDLNKRKLKIFMDKINNHQKVKPSEYQEFKDFSPEKSQKPTPEQIAKAYQTLAGAGINFPQAGGMTPEMMQMNMMGFGSQGGNNSKNMLPLLMMMQNQQGQENIDPQFMQTMLSNMMMPDLTNMYDDNNKKY